MTVGGTAVAIVLQRVNRQYGRLGFRDLGSQHTPMPQRAPMFLDGLARSGSADLERVVDVGVIARYMVI